MKKTLAMNKEDIFSYENKLNLVKIFYSIILVYYLFVLFFFCFTNGSIQNSIQDNFIYILLPLALPIVLSFVGLNNFKIEKNAEYIKIYSDCIFMSTFSNEFSKKMIINIHEPFENIITLSHFGLRKFLVIKYFKNNKLVKSKVNISLLSKKELNDLQKKLKTNK